MSGNRYSDVGNHSFLMSGDVYESDGHVDLQRYDQHGDYLSGLVLRGLRYGHDYLCQFTTRDDLLVHMMGNGITLKVTRLSDARLYDWIWNEYRGPRYVSHSVDWSQVSAVLPSDLGVKVRGLVRYSDKRFGLAVLESEEPSSLSDVSREVVYVPCPMGTNPDAALRWGGGVYRTVRGRLSTRCELLDTMWWKIRTCVLSPGDRQGQWIGRGRWS